MTTSYSYFLDTTVLTTSAADLVTVAATPTSNLLRGGRMRLTNKTAGAVTVTLYNVPPAGTAGTTNEFVSAKSVPANDYIDVDLPIIRAGGKVQGLAGAGASINVSMLSGSIFS